MKGLICNEAELEACVGKTPAAVNLKVIDHIDATARRWLETSPLGVVGLGKPGQAPGVGLVGGLAGFAEVIDAGQLRLPLNSLESPTPAEAGMGFGSLFFSPGLGETLRINGRISAVTPEALWVTVQECYLHCAKALIRSAFWRGNAAAGEAAPNLEASPFAVVVSQHRNGSIDVSPKGDPAGGLLQVNDHGICFADRPGNRRMDSLRNILNQPQVAVLAMFPGLCQVASFSGAASISAAPRLRQTFTVQGRTPALVVAVDSEVPQPSTSQVLARAQLWPVKQAADDIDPAGIFTAHVRLNKAKGVGATIVRATASKGLLKQGLKHDYKKNLY